VLYQLSILALIIPLIGGILAGFLGKTIGKTFTNTLTIFSVLASFLISSYILYTILNQPDLILNQNIYQWLEIGSYSFNIGLLIDNLTASMMVVVTFVSLMVHIYSIGYMHDDPGYHRFFSYISLFTFAMLSLVMANNFLQLFFGWEAVGVMSYLLIGFWFTKESAIKANFKAFIINRVGDMFLLLGIALLFSQSGSLDYSTVFSSGPMISNQLFFITDDWSVSA